MLRWSREEAGGEPAFCDADDGEDDTALRQVRAVKITQDERMLALLLQRPSNTVPPEASPSGVARRPSSATSANLVWAIEDHEGSLHVLDRWRPTTIGRSRSCHIKVEATATGKSVSGVHASIKAVGKDRWELQDHSSFGTFLKSTLLLGSHAVMQSGDTFHLGGANSSATFTLRCLNATLGDESGSWKWRDQTQSAREAAAASAALAAADERRRRKELAEQVTAANKLVRASSERDFYQELRLSGSSFRGREVERYDGTVEQRRKAGKGTSNSENTFDQAMSMSRDSHVQVSEEERERRASTKRIIEYSTGIFGAPKEPGDKTLVPKDTANQFSRHISSNSRFPRSFAARQEAQRIRQAQQDRRVVAERYVHPHLEAKKMGSRSAPGADGKHGPANGNRDGADVRSVSERSDSAHMIAKANGPTPATLPAYSSTGSEPATVDRGRSQDLGKSLSGCEAPLKPAQGVVGRESAHDYSDNFATKETSWRNDGSWARQLDDLDCAPPGEEPSGANSALLQLKRRTEAKAAAEEAAAAAAAAAPKRALTLAEKAKKERDDHAHDHEFLTYFRRQEEKRSRAMVISKLRHRLVVQGERERAAAGDRLLDEEDLRLMHVEELVKEEIEPLGKPHLYIASLHKKKKER